MESVPFAIPYELVETAQVVAAARLGAGCRNLEEYERDMDEASRLTKFVGEQVCSLIIKQLHGTTSLR